MSPTTEREDVLVIHVPGGGTVVRFGTDRRAAWFVSPRRVTAEDVERIRTIVYPRPSRRR